MRVRYSLRTLVVAMALAPAAAYWFCLPTVNAHRFAATLATGDYEAAKGMCVDQEHAYPGEEKSWMSFKASVGIEKVTWRDWALGRRRMKYFWEAHMGSMVMSFVGRDCLATRRGIEFREVEE
jgi:hypothetical protein